jgi:hypothetical protein
MTRIGVATALASILMLGSASFAGQKDQTFTGEITDNRCARMGSHQAMMKSMSMKSPKECALGCVDQTKPEQFAAENVVGIGSLNKDTRTIHVTDVKRVP